MLHLRLEGDRLELTPLSHEWFGEHLRAGRPIGGISATLDQKENALLVSPVDRLRDWLRVIRRRPGVRGVGDVCAQALALRRERGIGGAECDG